MKQKRLFSYQKLKLENERLAQEIYHLVKYPNSITSLEIQTTYLFKYELENAVMLGSPLS